MLEFFQTGKLLKHITATTLCLMPKCDQSEDLSQFNPIAYYKVLYKIISKILSNRLKKILPRVIDPVQSAFVETRVIMRNIFICKIC